MTKLLLGCSIGRFIQLKYELVEGESEESAVAALTILVSETDGRGR